MEHMKRGRSTQECIPGTGICRADLYDTFISRSDDISDIEEFHANLAGTIPIDDSLDCSKLGVEPADSFQLSHGRVSLLLELISILNT